MLTDVTAVEPATRSVRGRVAARMNLLAMQSRFSRSMLELDASLAGMPPDQVRTTLLEQYPALEDIDRQEHELTVQMPAMAFPDGDASCLVHDEPIFGDLNPPEPEAYLYHYTSVPTLAKIAETMSLRFGRLADMNDPQEALDSSSYMSGLCGPPGEPLLLSPEEAAEFESTDWCAEINAVRRNIKVGCFSMDRVPDLSDIDPELAAYSAPRRLAAHRGFAHPRMWDQYGEGSSGVCLVLDDERLCAAVEGFVSARFPWGYGPVAYGEVDEEQSLGFFDARDLLHQGVAATLLYNFQESLLTKHADWAQEAEFRYLVIDDSPDCFVPITRGVIAGMILGPKFEEQHLEEVQAFASRFGIVGRVRAMKMSGGRMALRHV